MVNYLALLLAGVVSMVIGMLWYSPMLFGKQWMSLSGMTQKQIDVAKKKGMTMMYVVNFISTLVMAFVLEYLLEALSANTVVAGAMVGFLMWLGFVGTVTLGSVLWEGKSNRLWFLNNGYQVINLIVMGIILALM